MTHTLPSIYETTRVSSRRLPLISISYNRSESNDPLRRENVIGEMPMRKAIIVIFFLLLYYVI